MKEMKQDSNIEQRMRSLEREIRYHQDLYYIKNRPIISDREFDRLLDELINLEAHHPELTSPDSPTRMVGSDLDAEFPKFKHTVPILSLSNTYSTNEAIEWAQKATEGRDLLIDVQWKVDGATLVLYYEKGRLIRAVTRGSGQIGDEVTANALTIRNIPHVLTREVSLVVRGEAYMTFEDFQAFNEQYGSVFANPRNLTAGSLKQKKSREVAQRPIRWVAFDSHFEIDEPLSDRECLETLRELGLPVFGDNAYVKVNEIKNIIEEFEKKKDKFNLPIDGLVLKIDDRSIRSQQGFTAQAPRWAVALKFEPEMARTVVEKIETFVGRTGRVTPRAKLGPVHLAGTTVSYATLHNADFIKNLDVREGSTVIVSKRGEIIPAVEEVVDRGPGEPYAFPATCPSCGTPLVRDEDAVDWLCPSDGCSEKIISGIIFFAGRKQMDINGLGEKIVRILYEKKFIGCLEDLYRLKERRAELEELEGFGEKSVRLLLEGIERSIQRDFRYVLPALGLREIGPSVTELLIASGYRLIDDMIRLASLPDARERLVEIGGIGPRTADLIVEQLTDPAVLKRIKTLRSYGLRFESEPESEKREENLPQIFEGQTWCVTGSFARFNPRDRAMEEVRRRGGRVVSAVTSKTTHLLAGEKGGSKIEKARKYGTHIVSEAEFLEMIGW
jgi:DNA ligase (NAD+)